MACSHRHTFTYNTSTVYSAKKLLALNRSLLHKKENVLVHVLFNSQDMRPGHRFKGKGNINSSFMPNPASLNFLTCALLGQLTKMPIKRGKYKATNSGTAEAAKPSPVTAP